MGTSYSSPRIIESKHFARFVKAQPAQSGKTFAITGCTTGTGFIFAKTVAALGGNLVLLNRPSERAQLALAQLAKAATASPHGPGTVQHVDCDLTSFASVRAAAAQINTEYKSIDVLVNNAGVMALADTATTDGADIQMQVNHLSHFLLTKLVWPCLEAAAEAHGEARVINHSSIQRHKPWMPLTAKYLGKHGGALGGNSAGMRKGARWQRYQQTKLANYVFTHALKERLTAAGSTIKSLVAHPGFASTHLFVTSKKEGGMGMLTGAMMRAAQSQEDGTLGILSCALLPEDKVPNGAFYGPGSRGMRGKAVIIPLEPRLMADGAGDLLWNESLKTVGEASWDLPGVDG